jgi:uncharacterized protein (TIGR01615 family)
MAASDSGNDSGPLAAAAPPPASGAAASTAPRGSLDPGGAVDVEGIARELLAAGYLVQLRDEAAGERPRDVRQCLQQLRHRFVVCMGARGAGDDCGGEEPHYLAEPLVVEPRFRDQFVIAQPTRAYEALLEAVPPCFVGTAARLEAVVAFLCEEMAGAFKQQGLAVPPWRSKQATLSKWAPQQLAALAAKIAGVRRAAMAGGAVFAGGPAAHHAQLQAGARPAAGAVAHAAAGSAPAAGRGSEPMAGVVMAVAVDGAAASGPQPQFPRDLAAQPAHAPGLPAPAQQHGGGARHYFPSPVDGPTVKWADLPGGGGAGVAIAVEAADAFMTPPAAMCPPPPSQQQQQQQQQQQHQVVVTNSNGAATPLKFTRKASAEWKERRPGSGGKKVKSLLAAALKKSGSRGNLSSAAAAAAGGAAVAAAAAQQRSGGGGGEDAAAAARRAAAPIRTTPNEAGWGCITTVRWGAFHDPQQQQHQLQQQPSQQ